MLQKKKYNLKSFLEKLNTIITVNQFENVFPDSSTHSFQVNYELVAKAISTLRACIVAVPI